MLQGLKEKLSKEEFDVVMEIMFTPTEDLIAEAKEELRRKALEDIRELNKQLETFNKLRNKYILNADQVKVCDDIIQELEIEKEELNAKYNPAADTGRNMRRYVVGGEKTNGGPGDSDTIPAEPI